MRGRIGESGEDGTARIATPDIIADLEQARRQGGVIGARDFRLAVDLVAEGGGSVSELSGVRLLGVRRALERPGPRDAPR